MTIAALDTDITNAFGLLAVLLVFIFAFFTTVWSRAEELIGKAIPADSTDKQRLRSNILGQLNIVIALGVGVLAVGLLLVPLSSRVLGAWHWHPFDTVRGSLLLLDIFMLAMLVLAVWLVVRLQQRANKAK